MYSFIAMAADAASADAQGSMFTTLITFALIIMIFYFLLIRPQKRRDQEARDMINAMRKGDKVVTIGGIHGTVAIIKEKTVVLKVDDNSRIEFNKSAISQIVEKKLTEEEKVAAEKAKAELEARKAELEAKKAAKKGKKKGAQLETIEAPAVEAPAAEEAEAEAEESNEEKSED